MSICSITLARNEEDVKLNVFLFHQIIKNPKSHIHQQCDKGEHPINRTYDHIAWNHTNFYFKTFCTSTTSFFKKSLNRCLSFDHHGIIPSKSVSAKFKTSAIRSTQASNDSLHPNFNIVCIPFFTFSNPREKKITGIKM